MPVVSPLRRRLTLAASVAAAALIVGGLAGCAPGASNSDSSACTPSKKPVTLDYWAWGSGNDEVIALWNKEHPNIQVKASEIPTGVAGGYQKMFNAVKAGTAPDLAFIEYDTIPSFKTQDAIRNVDDCLKAGIGSGSDFVPGVWSQSTLGQSDSAYSLPSNSGPMALYYRSDLLKQYGIPVPTTWDEFAAAAEKVHAADPTVYLANFATNSPNWFAGLASQAGAQWFKTNSDSWSVSVDDPATKKVAQYWQKLINEGAVSTIPDFSPEWNAAVAAGKLIAWPSAVWGTGILKSAAPDEAGKWSVAQLPQWGSKNVSASWGGGGTSIFKSTKHPYEATEFAYWLSTDPKALAILKRTIGLYPTAKKLLSGPLFKGGDDYFAGQAVYDEFSTASADLPSFTWGPAMGDTYAALTDSFTGQTTPGSSNLLAAVGTAQSTIVKGLEKQGINVK